MKLQKLLKKLALPVFALVVVSMLAACSSPSGGGSDSNGGGGGGSDYTPPALDPKTNYELSTDDMPDQVKDVLEKALEDAGIEASDSLTGAQIEEIKEALSEAGYTYTEKDGTITIIEKPAPSDDDSDKPSENITPLSREPLFAASEVTVAASKIEWTEGEWLLQFIQEELTGDQAGTIIIEERKIKADSSGISITGVKETVYGTLPADATEEQIAAAKKRGYIFNENGFTYVKEADAKELEEANNRIKDDSWYEENLKTNADKTKYYWTYSGEHSSSVGTWVVRKCLKKLSGTSTPVILPDSSDVNEEEKPVNKPNEPEQNGQSGSSENSSTYNIKYNDIYLNKDMPAKTFSLDSFLQKFDTSQYTKSGNTIILNDEGLDILISESGKYENKTYVTLVVYDNHMLEPLIQDDFNTLCKGLNYETDYETFAGTKIIILTDSGYEKAKEFFIHEGSSSEEHSGNSYKGKINPNQKYNVFDNKEYNGKEVKGSTFIATVLEHGWVEGKDYTVDNDKFTITFSDYKAPSESNTNDSTTQEDKPATLPEGIEADKNYTVTVSGSPKTMTGSDFAMMVELYDFDDDDYTVSEDTITITTSGLTKIDNVVSNSYDIIYKGENIDKIPKAGFEMILGMTNLADSEYSIDEDSKTITLTDAGYTTYLAFMAGKNGKTNA